MVFYYNKTVAVFKCAWSWLARSHHRVNCYHRAVSIQICRLANIGISIIRIRRFHDRLVFIMEIPIPGKTVFILKRSPGPRLNIKTVLSTYGDSMLKIRRSWDRLIFNMGIPILVRWHLYIETAPWFLRHQPHASQRLYNIVCECPPKDEYKWACFVRYSR